VSGFWRGRSAARKAGSGGRHNGDGQSALGYAGGQRLCRGSGSCRALMLGGLSASGLAARKARLASCRRGRGRSAAPGGLARLQGLLGADPAALAAPGGGEGERRRAPAAGRRRRERGDVRRRHRGGRHRRLGK
jgi:hypothetical protein